MLNAENILNQLRDVDTWIFRAEQALDNDHPDEASVYAHMAFARAVATLATAIVAHAAD